MDIIDRQVAIDAHCELCVDKDVCSGDICPDVELFQLLPSAHPEIIHCRDCKYWQSEEHIGNNNVHTSNIASLPCKNWLTRGDWYCGSAKRRTDD